jgi:hypothetical protein
MMAPNNCVLQVVTNREPMRLVTGKVDEQYCQDRFGALMLGLDSQYHARLAKKLDVFRVVSYISPE